MPDLSIDKEALSEQQIRLQHILALREDVRGEARLRIQQRDNYSIQMTIALGTIIGVATTATAAHLGGSDENSLISYAYRSLIAAPLVAIYFSILIFYSYRIHGLLAKYLREVIEPLLADLCHVDRNIEWETWYCQNAVPGIRKTFFIGSLWVVTIASPLYIAFTEKWQGAFMLPLGIISLLYLIVTIWITRHFWKG